MKNLNRRQFISLLSGGAIAVAATPFASCTDIFASAKRPNILFCISDDHNWRHAGIYGSKMVKTPAFDRVARHGVLFNNTFVSATMCCPSRGSVLTGQAFYRLEDGAMNHYTLKKKFQVYPDILEAAGYFVGYTGKGWGPGNWRAAGRTRNPAGTEYNKLRCTSPTKGISDRDYAANCEDFLNQRPAEKPFCFWFGSYEPHRSFEKGSGLRAGKKLEHAELPPYLPDTEAIRTDMLDYALEIEWFDTHVGRMLKTLEKTDELDNTIVVVTGDNGMPFPRAKATCYDDGTREPLAICWRRKVKGGRVVDDFISFTDFAPTFLEAAGLKPAPGTTGKSFLNVLLSKKSGQIDPARDHAISGREKHTPRDPSYPMRSIRTKKYLYIRNDKHDHSEIGPAGKPPRYIGADGRSTKVFMVENRDANPQYKRLFELAFGYRPAEELSDVQKDPYQMHNLAVDTNYSVVKKELAERLQRQLVRTNDPRALGKGDIFDSYTLPKRRTKN